MKILANKLQLIQLATILLITFSTCVVASSKCDSHARAEYCFEAAGSAYTSKLIMDSLVQVCPEDGEKMKTIWNARNSTIIEKAKDARKEALARVKKESNAEFAKKLEQRQNNYLEKQVDSFIAQISSSSKERQKFICNKFMSATQSGGRDFSVLEPEKYKFIMQF